MPRKSLPQSAGRPLSAVKRSWMLALKDTHKSPRTIHLYDVEADRLIAALGDVPVDKVTSADMRRFRDGLIEKGLADTTRNITHRALNVFFNFAVEEGDIETSPMAKMKAPTIDSEKSRRFHVPTDAELDRVFAEIAKDDHPHTRARDTAILRLLMDTGMRLGELSAMQLDDVDLDQRMAHIAGKTGYRSVRFSPKTARSARPLPDAAIQALCAGQQGALARSGRRHDRLRDRPDGPGSGARRRYLAAPSARPPAPVCQYVARSGRQRNRPPMARRLALRRHGPPVQRLRGP